MKQTIHTICATRLGYIFKKWCAPGGGKKNSNFPYQKKRSKNDNMAPQWLRHWSGKCRWVVLFLDWAFFFFSLPPPPPPPPPNPLNHTFKVVGLLPGVVVMELESPTPKCIQMSQKCQKWFYTKADKYSIIVLC